MFVFNGHAVRKYLGAVGVNRAQQAAGDQIGRGFQTVEQRTDVSVAGFHGTAKFVVLPLVAGQAVLRALNVLVFKRNSGVGFTSAFGP